MSGELKGNITSLIDGATALVRISNPSKRNALEPDSYWAIGDAVQAANANPEVRCIIVTGDEKSFCSGMDIEAFTGESTAEVAAHSLGGIEHMIGSITRADVPVIAAAEGAVAGVGASLACACDLIVAAESAFITLPFGRIGLMPDGGAVATLAASIGRHRAMQLVLLQERIPAADAVDFGLFAEVTPTGGALEKAKQWAESFTASPRGAVAETKRAVNRVSLTELPNSMVNEARFQTELLQSPGHKEGVAAFLERRAPKF
ncbi:enoyl-CoA hydratase/2-(1,2-epoxy-1,2-dihydrophenyl)acetyl-CoA isomerase [Corynebacterium appendicis CIP 107643]|uniref:Enoyl-CoA hydratase/2-(1,2-epoxy-1,2-dihydrophenyl)acetyl-CoA isomerase n=1 Tax=Corynebacterium appendicis CIP 107643 TaxID=1161099 RepID=A0A1N7JQ22_9CORY|nr:enoyl-CoA hydratase-related protein [Corynebacterium appendicis]WJY61703.1 putative enoyl-CoA hydratase echA8 [Corynebacterium appendicis CIP 107643]SIS51452.1 enoyl-CoA hydratase/2-(1,2-epoxy-1,2-dihydrophenyl)acetyl-CoA isomerase [Corynebacterium appendicis CIP 107643]